MSKIKINMKGNDVIISSDSELINMRFFKKIISMQIVNKIDETTYILNQPKYYKLSDVIEKLSAKQEIKNYNLIVSEDVYEYIYTKSLNIKKLSEIGSNIKKNGILNEEFQTFSKIIQENVSRNLYDIQLEMAYHMYKVKRTMNFSVPGTGKTSMVLGLFAYLNHDVSSKEYCDKIVVFCPKNAFKSWVDEFQETFQEKKPLNYFTPSITNDSKYEIAINYNKYNLILVNYEKVGSYNDALKYVLKSKSLVVFDEIHRIKSVKGKRAQYAIDYIKTNGHLVALTGTPIPNGYLDIVNMLKILFQDDYDLMDFTYFNFNKLSSNEKNVIGNRLNPFFLRVTKDMLKIPPPNKDIFHEVSLSEKESDALRLVANKELNFLAKFVRFNQVLSAPSKFKIINTNEFKSELNEFSNVQAILDSLINNKFSDSEIMTINNIGISSKMKYTINLINKLVLENKKVIVWCIYTDTIKLMKKLLIDKDIKVDDITGNDELAQREELIDEFNNDRLDVIITNPKTLAESVSLHKLCHDAIYFEVDYDLSKFLQSKDRIHRLGLDENQYTQYHYITTKLTNEYSIEKAVLERLKEKELEMMNFFENDTYVYNFSEIERKDELEEIIIEFNKNIE